MIADGLVCLPFMQFDLQDDAPEKTPASALSVGLMRWVAAAAIIPSCNHDFRWAGGPKDWVFRSHTHDILFPSWHTAILAVSDSPSVFPARALSRLLPFWQHWLRFLIFPWENRGFDRHSCSLGFVSHVFHVQTAANPCPPVPSWLRLPGFSIEDLPCGAEGHVPRGFVCSVSRTEPTPGSRLFVRLLERMPDRILQSLDP